MKPQLRLMAAGAVLATILTGYSAAAAGRDHAPAAERFIGSLDPVPFQAPTRPSVGAEGRVAATLEGATLRIDGRFSASPSPASRVQLMQGLAIGVPGTVIGELSFEAAGEGRIGGDLALAPSQIEALRLGHLYLRIDTQSSPAGSAWAWLFPERSDLANGGKS